ncbi:MAG TPA: protein kinase [Kofleriaceae bacterium]|nr:protein kinase [Kofleriaceae bacterium]
MESDDAARGPRGTHVLPHLRETVVATDGSTSPRPEATSSERTAPKHQLVKLLGKGGMGEVFVAFDPALRRRVAFKRLLPEHHQNPNLSARFLTEVQVTAQLDHPNVVPVNGFELSEDGTLGYSMKLVKGKDLAHHIEKWRGDAATWSVREAQRRLASRIDIFLRICEAMTYAHEKGVLHRDLKPENVMVGTFNDVYVMDWGIFRVIGSPAADDAVSMSPEAAQSAGHGKTLDGMVLGTPGYMSPEQANGMVSTLDARSDLFTLGIILAELVTLRSARPASTVEDALNMARSGYVPPLVSATPRLGIARELRAIVARATQIDPGRRYASVHELSDDLRRYLRTEAVAASPDNAVQKAARWIGRHRMVALATILALLAVGAGAVAWQIRRSSQAEEALMRRHARHQALAVAAARHADALDAQLGRWQVAAAGFVGRASVVLADDDHGAGASTTPVFLSTAFDSGNGPPDLARSRRYGTDVSLDAPVVQLAPGVTFAGDIERQAARAVGLRRAMLDAMLATSPATAAPADDTAARALVLDTGVPALRAFVTSDDGVHVSLPGTGGFAPDYDGRTRKKYTSALASALRPGSVAWGEPYADRHGLGLVLPIAGVVLAGDEVRGVAGLELSLAWIGEHALTTRLAGAKETLLLDASGRVVVHRVAGAAPVYATPEGTGESEDLRFASFTHEQARRAIAGPEAGVVELPDGRLVALYPLSTLPYTFVLIADPRAMTP